MSEPNYDDELSPDPAWVAILLACLWIALGAAFKLHSASPMDVPEVVRDLARNWLGLDAAGTYRAAITIELWIVATAILRPRLGWILLVIQYLIFLGILVQLMVVGAEHCGCFGGTVDVKPWQMALVDGSLLLGLLASRPWLRLPVMPGHPIALFTLAGFFGLAAWAPYYFFTTADAPLMPGTPEGKTTDVSIQGEDSTSPDALMNEQGTEANTPANETGPVLPDFAELHPESWEGSDIGSLDLARWLTEGADMMYMVPPGARVILYRRSCDVCATHLEELALNPDPSLPIALIRIPDADESVTTLVEVLPEAVWSGELHHLKKGYAVQTPQSFEVSDELTVQNLIDLSEGH